MTIVQHYKKADEGVLVSGCVSEKIETDKLSFLIGYNSFRYILLSVESSCMVICHESSRTSSITSHLPFSSLTIAEVLMSFFEKEATTKFPVGD